MRKTRTYRDRLLIIFLIGCLITSECFALTACGSRSGNPTDSKTETASDSDNPVIVVESVSHNAPSTNAAIESTPESAGDLILGDAQFDAYLPALSGKRVALFSNQTGLVNNNPDEGHILDALIEHDIDVTAIFCPEHGFRGTADAGASVDNSIDEKTGVPIISLYGNANDPSSDDNANRFDVLVIDIQDVGLRFYTYYLTMATLLEACADNDKPVILLDRPNPNCSYIDGPILQEGFHSGIGKYPLPIVYGMTLGELADMMNAEGWLQTGANSCQLTVIPCLNYTRNTPVNLPVNPSPNLKDMRAIYLYASICLFENTAISVGRGTDGPFTMFGSPYLQGAAGYEYSFTPSSMSGAQNPPFENQECFGIDLSSKPLTEICDEQINLDYLINAYHAMQDTHPEVDFFGKADKNGHYYLDLLSGSDDLRKRIIAGENVDTIKASWQAELMEFDTLRSPYLLYD